MRRTKALALAVLVLASASPAGAQDPPRPIGPFAIDVRATLPRFGGDEQLADSRGLTIADLPGSGLGLDVGAHVYLFKWKAMTVGVGGQLTFARSHSSGGESQSVVTRAVTERFLSVVPQVSMNFGSGSGWSYLSGGVGTSTWSIVPDDQQPLPADNERLITFNYGGGARWFARPRVAFTFDVRFHAIAPGTPELGFVGSPRTRMLILGAGVSVR